MQFFSRNYFLINCSVNLFSSRLIFIVQNTSFVVSEPVTRAAQSEQHSTYISIYWWFNSRSQKIFADLW